MDPYAAFLGLMIIATPVTLVCLLSLIFDWKVLDLPGFLYGSFAVATLAMAGMLAILFTVQGFSLAVLFGLYVGLYILLLCVSVSRIVGDLQARWAESRVPRKPFEDALLAERQGKLPLAARLYRDYCSYKPTDEEALRHYAACLVKLSRFPEAVEALQRAFAVTDGTRHMDIGMEIAYILQAKMGDTQAARAHLKELKRSYFNTNLEGRFDNELKRLLVRITGDPRPFEEKIDLN